MADPAYPDSTGAPATPGSRLSAALLRPFSSLRGNRDFRGLFLSNLAFFGGVWTMSFILGWMVFEQTRSELLVATFTTIRLLPLLLGPIAGVFSDRHDRRRILIGACLLALVAVAAVAALVTAGLGSFWVLTAAGLVLGLAQSPSQPARAALVAERVPAGQLSNANALNSLVFSTTLMLGPAVGGITVSLFGASIALWLCLPWFLASLLAIRGTRSTHVEPEEPHGSVWRMLWEGLVQILRFRVVAAVLLVTVATNSLIWAIQQGFMPVFAQQVLHLDASGLGLLLTGSGLGGIAGSLIIAAIGDFRWKGAVFLGGTATMALLWMLFAISGDGVLPFVLFTAAGLVSATFGVLQTTLMLAATPPALQGRAMGLQELAIGAQPLAAIVIGISAHAFGIAVTTAVSAGLLIVILLAVALTVPALVRYHGTGGGVAVVVD